ncbi:MAG TPA: WYL domain-containing protein [Actinomycetes bacterium]|nr:WYL domain-containing protein [Actinomycetes bacterium]
MAAPRTERLLNLVICLLAATRYVSKDQIRRGVPQYGECATTEAFERMFERDKDDLRDMGIPLETGTNEAFFDDEIGYRIPKDAYALPEITFDSEELAILGLAARTWQQATMSGAASQALRKLEAAGVDVDREALGVIEPRVDAAEPAFGPLLRALQQRSRVTFEYSRAGAAPEPRSLEPWGLASWNGRWYVAGHDLDRKDTRVFRLSRITSEVKVVGRKGAYEVPPDTDVTALIHMLAQPAPTSTARLRVRSGRALPLVRRGTVVSRDDEWTSVDLPFEDVHQLASHVSGFGSAVVVDSPESVRSAVVARLAGALDAVKEGA